MTKPSPEASSTRPQRSGCPERLYTVAAQPADQERLWHYGLRWIEGAINLQIPHRPLDEQKMIWLLQDMYAVGERPPSHEFKPYMDQLWPHAPAARKMARDPWRPLLRNPPHRFRRIRWR